MLRQPLVFLVAAFSAVALPLVVRAVNQPNFQTPFLSRFVDELPTPPRIRVPVSTAPQDISIQLTAVSSRLNRDMPETQMWGYNQSSPGPTIEVESGQMLRVHWQNRLPPTHILAAPKGMMVPGGDSAPDVRSVTHLHGAVVAQPSTTDRFNNNDGWPDAWIVPGQDQLAEYPNPQSARLLWYHDHAVGETGRNVAAGLVGLYIIRDAYERSLNLPSDSFEIPLLIQAHGINGDGTLFYTNDITSEFYGNSITVNGKLWPYLNVEPRKYRFRMLNASNARTVDLKLLDYTDQKQAGPAFYQIGTDSGFLENTAVLNDPNVPTSPRLTLAPAERADVIIDFSAFAGRQLLLHNSNLGESGDGQLPIPQLMLFKVASAVTAPDTSSLPMKMAAIHKLAPESAAVTRKIVIGHQDMPNGEPMLLMNGARWNDPITEKPTLDSTEVWEIINTEPDTHPFHVHLVEFQVLDRTPFDVQGYLKNGVVTPTGAVESPDPNEQGWKDVVRVTPGKVTRIIMHFGPYTGYYVYHCHILEHEDMDMMRPFEVIAP